MYGATRTSPLLQKPRCQQRLVGIAERRVRDRHRILVAQSTLANPVGPRSRSRSRLPVSGAEQFSPTSFSRGRMTVAGRSYSRLIVTSAKAPTGAPIGRRRTVDKQFRVLGDGKTGRHRSGRELLVGQQPGETRCWWTSPIRNSRSARRARVSAAPRSCRGT